MKQFEGFQDKQAVPSFTRNGVYQAVALPFLDDDAKLVSVEVYLASGPAEVVGVAPTWSGWAGPSTNFSVVAAGYSTVIMRVGVFKTIALMAPAGGSTVFSITGQWGGESVKAFVPTFPIATGFVAGDDGVYKDYDLSSILPAEDRGNVEAIICYARPALGGDSADARANGSTWVGITPRADPHRFDTIVKVDDDDMIEVRVSFTGKPGPVQNAWVYFVGYILRDETDDGTGDFYRYHAIADPVDDVVGSSSWQNYDVTGKTSADVVAIYWRQQFTGTLNDVPTYSREVGSSDAALALPKAHSHVVGRALDVDESKEVQHYMQGVATQSWIFGYLELVRRIGICIAAEPSAFPRVRALTSTKNRVAAVLSAFQRIAAITSTSNRVTAAASAFRRIRATISICGKVVNMKANARCPDELAWNSDNVLDLDEVLDDMASPPAAITSATSVECSIFDADNDSELTAVSPVTLNQVGSTNHWRNTVTVNADNGFTRKQRLRLVYTFDGGAGLLGEFEAFGIVAAAVN
jgi:hypothetical protein